MPGQCLPIKAETGGKATVGFCTPQIDKKPQVMRVPPKRVLPIIFIPGIMGSNLRLSEARQRELAKTNNVAWRPDSKAALWETKGGSPAWRQKMLDPDATEVDSYDEGRGQTGDPGETVMARNSAVQSRDLYGWQKTDPSVLLVDDPLGTPNGKTKEQKQLERGWGEVFFGSYGKFLTTCEQHFNDPFMSNGEPSIWWRDTVLNVQPRQWGAAQETPLEPLDAATLQRALAACWFPVHAMGYNWLISNGESGGVVANRIRKIMESYRAKGFICRKVILVTHSMGGLVARAAMHPAFGGLQDDVLGVIHGVMPALGAGAAYKRIRCGFEGLASEVLGKSGREVTAVLGNSPGGMELLPNTAYGNGWLQVRYKESILLRLPKNGDPYDEIYKVQGKWFQLFNPSWVNPANDSERGIAKSLSMLETAKQFHQKIQRYYHPNSYAHYGADPSKQAWRNVVWDLSADAWSAEIADYQILYDSAIGKLRLGKTGKVGNDRGLSLFDTAHMNPNTVSVALLPAKDPGDETVPLYSADDQLLSGRFKGIFRQTGYEHQASYKADNAIASTFYSLVQIIQKIDWGEK